MIHENFYAKYHVIKSSEPVNSDSTHIIRVSFYHNKTKVGQAYIYDFDTDNGFLFDFKIYKKYRFRHYGTDAMEYLTTHFQMHELNVHESNKHAIHIYHKFNFVITAFLLNEEDGKTYYEMRNN